MSRYHAGEIVRFLSRATDVLYYLVLAGAVFVLAGLPVAYALSDDRSLTVDVPVNLRNVDVHVASPWDPGGRVRLSDIQAEADVRIVGAPIWFLVLEWVALAALFGMMTLFLSHMRRLLDRVEDGVPFDPRNASHLRWMGALLIAVHVTGGVAGFVASLALTRGVQATSVRPRFDFELNVILVGLVILALSEIFRYGAALEEERALVV